VLTLAELAAARKLLHAVPYSLHCSFEELRAFVSWLRPRAVCGIVKGTSAAGRCADPAVHFAGLLRGWEPGVTKKRHPLDVEQRGAIGTWQVEGCEMPPLPERLACMMLTGRRYIGQAAHVGALEAMSAVCHDRQLSLERCSRRPLPPGHQGCLPALPP